MTEAIRAAELGLPLRSMNARNPMAVAKGGDCGSNHLVLFVSYIPLSCFKLVVNCKMALASTLLGRQLQVMQAPRLVQRTLLSRPIHCSASR